MSMVDPLNPLLWRACLAGDVALIDKMMARGADAHIKDRNGETCLHMAARSGEVDALERMLEEGLNLDTANHNGQTPLHVAVNKDHLGIIRYIVRQGGDLDLTTKFSGMTGLHVACKDNNEDVVKFLLDNGANCAIKDKIQKYPDFYTNNKSILATFDEHFEVCTHGRRKGQQNATTNPSGYLLGAITMETETDQSQIYTAASSDSPRASRRYSRDKAPTVSRDASGTAVIDDEEEVDKARTRTTHGGGRTHHTVDGKERGGPSVVDWDHGDVTIYDKMEKYDADRAKENWEVAKHDAKKLRINHKMEFSEQHQKRMQQNVFDRLLGSKAKKGEDKTNIRTINLID